MRRSDLRPAVLALLLYAAGCRGGEAVDLGKQFAAATPSREVSRIDLGDAAARPHLVSGWDIDERWGDSTIAWATGTHSALVFHVGAVRPLTLGLRAWPLPYADRLPPQRLTLRLNGEALATLTLAPAAQEYRVAVPAAALREGRNWLDVDYAWARRPRDLDPNSADPRSLAVAWDWVRLDGLADAAAPQVRADADGTELVLPAGSGLELPLDVPAGARLEFPAVAADDDAAPDAALRVELIRDGGDDGRRNVATLAVDPAAQRLPLTDGGALLLALRPAHGAGLRLRAPRLLAPAAAAPPATPCAAAAGGAPAPLLIYLVDTLRADRVGGPPDGRPPTPAFDAFARDAVRFSDAVSAAPWTKPALASLFTGLTPHRHGVTTAATVLGPTPTLAARLAAAGYDTMAVGTNVIAGPDTGLLQGFADVRFLPEQPLDVGGEPTLIHQRAEVVHAEALAWLDARRSAAPFFLYLHVSDPHTPYLAPEPFRSRFAAGVDARLGLITTIDPLAGGRRIASADERAAIVALYDAEVAYADHAFGALVEALRARQLYDRTLIVLVADHGESFGEHGAWGHANALTGEQVRVPLLVKLPQQRYAGTVVDDVTPTVDLLPTLLAALGQAVPPGLGGASLLPRIACGAAGTPPPAYAHVRAGDIAEFESLQRGGDKLVLDVLRGGVQLFDLAADPGATRDVSRQRPATTAVLRARLADFRRLEPLPAATRAVSAADAERLRALGYAP